MTNKRLDLSRLQQPLARGDRTQALSQAVLRELLRSGARPGDRLPTEHELADRFGVSRPTVRQALKSLDAAGLVESKPRRGTVLRRPNLRSLAPWFGAHVALALAGDPAEADATRATLSALAEARWLIERSIGVLVAARRTETDLDALRQAASDYERSMAGDDLQPRIAADAAFHHAYVNAAHNPVLSGFAEVIDGYFQIRSEVQTRLPMPTRKTFDRTLREHRALCAAIEARDGAKTKALMDKHLRPILKAHNVELP
ncbi:MAG: FCD domain-containing protein [Planctomycetota bacterium]|nr:FCD domain-containing protein [Planctomycetota bacterium]